MCLRIFTFVEWGEGNHTCIIGPKRKQIKEDGTIGFQIQQNKRNWNKWGANKFSCPVLPLMQGVAIEELHLLARH